MLNDASADDADMAARSTPQPRTSMAVPTFAASAMVVGLAVVVVLLGGLRPLGAGGGHSLPATPSPSVAFSPDPTPTATSSPRPTPTSTALPTARPVPTRVPTPIPTPVPAQTPAPAQTLPPVPAGPPDCAYDDRPAAHAGYADWPITLLDTIFYLPATYAPGDLVDSSDAGLNGGYPIRAIVVDDLRAMAAAAAAAGAPIGLVSGYRSYPQQAATFDHWVSVGGYEQALRTSARPGHSEHQLGTAIDVTSAGGGAPWEVADWASTPTGAWMEANAWRYGFVMSYPRAAFDRTCYDYEPWHYRYVGRAIAAEIAARGLAPRQVLWELQ